MDSQKISQLVENRELYPITDIGGELNFIFKSSLFWRPTYLAQSAWLEHIPFAFWLVDTLGQEILLSWELIMEVLISHSARQSLN